ncbi:MAG: iron chaperone [Saprospiraceae bacterium]
MAKAPPDTISAYIATFPTETQEILEQVRTTIQKAAPEATEAIKYAIPTFVLKGKNLVHFAAFKNHIGFYATPAGQEAFQEELSGYKSGKGSVQFPIEEPMPLDLIARIVKFRVEEHLEKPGKKK